MLRRPSPPAGPARAAASVPVAVAVVRLAPGGGGDAVRRPRRAPRRRRRRRPGRAGRSGSGRRASPGTGAGGRPWGRRACARAAGRRARSRSARRSRATKPRRVRSRPSGPRVRLVDDHDAAGARRAPGLPRRARRRNVAAAAEVGLFVGRRARRHGEVDVHGVVGAARPQLRGLRRREHVVGRRDDVVERDVVAIADASEGGDVGHRSPGGGGGGARLRGQSCDKYTEARGAGAELRGGPAGDAEGATATGG